MSEITDFHQVQRRIFQLMSFEDGLWDLLLGTIFMFLALYPVTRELLGPVWNLVLFLGMLALVVVVQLVVRHYVSTPRIGYVRPRGNPRLRLLVIITAVIVLGTISLVLVTLLSPGTGSTSTGPADLPTERGYLVEIIVLLVMGIIFSAMGYLFGVTRMYFYGWMLGLANLVSIVMQHKAGWTFMIPLAIASGVIILIGLVLLVRFLRQYPVQEEQV